MGGKPTVINNVETLCNIPFIARHGAAAYAALSPGATPGTKIVCLNERFVRPGAFEVRFGARLPEGEWTRDGFDRAEFFLSTNAGEEPRPLARIVSGGELSRVMLAIKTLAAHSSGRTPTSSAGMVFDEVDAGRFPGLYLLITGTSPFYEGPQ